MEFKHTIQGGSNVETVDTIYTMPTIPTSDVKQ